MNWPALFPGGLLPPRPPEVDNELSRPAPLPPDVIPEAIIAPSNLPPAPALTAEEWRQPVPAPPTVESAQDAPPVPAPVPSSAPDKAPGPDVAPGRKAVVSGGMPAGEAVAPERDPAEAPQRSMGERIAVAGARVGAEAAQAAVDVQEAAAGRLRAMSEQAQAEQARREEARLAAEQQVAERREAYRDVLKKGPQRSGAQWAGLLAAVVADAIGASLDPTGRASARTDRLMDTFLQAGQADFQRQLTAAGDEVQESGDELDALMREEGEAQLQWQAQRAAVYEDLAFELDSLAKNANSQLEAINYQHAGDLARAKAAEASRRAQLEAEQAYMRRVSWMQDTRLKDAQIGKVRREAAAARNAGQQREVGQGVRDPNTVYLPGTDEPLAVFSGKNAAKRASEATDMIVMRDDLLRQLNEYEGALEDYGKQGFLDSSSFAGSAEYGALETMRNNLKGPLAKVLSGGFNPTETDNALAEELVTLPAKWWQKQDMVMARLRTVKRNSEESFRTAMGKFLNTGQVERLIKHRRARAVSKKDAAEELASRAVEIAADADKPLDVRTQAVGAIEARAQSDAAKRGDRDDWLYLAVPAMISVRGELKANDKLVKEVDRRLRFYKKLATHRALKKDNIARIANALQDTRHWEGSNNRNLPSRQAEDRMINQIDEVLSE